LTWISMLLSSSLVSSARQPLSSNSSSIAICKRNLELI
jgi:hypothetical protein